MTNAMTDEAKIEEKGSNQNTVDTSSETVSREFSQLMAEARAYENSKPKLAEPGSEEEPAPEVNQAAIDAAGDQVKMMMQMPFGALLSISGSLIADTEAPNWRLHGLTDTHIDSVAMPLGAVADKYCLKYFGCTASQMIQGHEEEFALIVSSVILYKTFKNIPRHAEGAAEKLAEIRKAETKAMIEQQRASV